MEEAAKLQWEGKAKATLTNTTADQAWSLLKDFTNLHKILPTLHTCHLVEGIDGETGCIRYCAGAREDGVVMWAKERLIETDPVNRFNRYVVEENNMGFRRYFGRVRVVDGDGGGGGGGDGGGGEGACVIEWSYVADPIDGWAKENFEAYLRSSIETIARRIEETLQNGGGGGGGGGGDDV